MVQLKMLLSVLLASVSVFATPTPEHAATISTVSAGLETRDLLVGTVLSYESKSCYEGPNAVFDKVSIYRNHIYKLGSRQSFKMEWRSENPLACNIKMCFNLSNCKEGIYSNGYVAEMCYERNKDYSHFKVVC